QTKTGQDVWRRPRFRLCQFPLRLQPLLAAKASIRNSGGEELLRGGAVNIDALRLPIRLVRPAVVRTFIPIESEPAQIVEHHRFRLARRSRLVGVFDANDERATVPLREKPVEDCRARAADVEIAGRRWSKTNANGVAHRRGSLDSLRSLGMTIATIAIAQIPSPRPMKPR